MRRVQLGMVAMTDRETLHDQLNAVLRWDLTVVNQYFFHILVLRAWGDGETARDMAMVNNADVANAMRVLDHVIAAGETPALDTADAPFAARLPVIGGDYAAMFDADLALEHRLYETFDAAGTALSGRGDTHAEALVAEALSRRRPHAAWLEGRRCAAAPERAPLFGAATGELNRLLAELVVALEQAMAHAFVYWHAGDEGRASAIWTASFDAMMHGKAIVDLFGAAGTAPSLAAVAASGGIEGPRVGATVAEALMFERDVAGRCRAFAEAAAASLDGDAAMTCREIAAYYARLADWLDADAEPAETYPGAVRSFRALRAKFFD
jgi:bacterioferritin (cytochrome b1)